MIQSDPSDQKVGSISSGLVILSRLVGESNGSEGIGESNGPEGEDGVMVESDGGDGEEGVDDDGDGDNEGEMHDGDWESGKDMKESDGDDDLDEGGDWEETSEPSICFLLLIPISLPLDLSSLLM